MNLSQEFQTALANHLQAAQKIVDDHWTIMKFTHGQSPLLVVEEGKRYIAIRRKDRDKEGNVLPHSNSIHSFIDAIGGKVHGLPSSPGDIYKPADWRAPAKNKRGSIFADDYGASCMNSSGPTSLR